MARPLEGRHGKAHVTADASGQVSYKLPLAEGLIPWVDAARLGQMLIQQAKIAKDRHERKVAS